MKILDYIKNTSYYISMKEFLNKLKSKIKIEIVKIKKEKLKYFKELFKKIKLEILNFMKNYK